MIKINYSFVNDKEVLGVMMFKSTPEIPVDYSVDICATITKPDYDLDVKADENNGIFAKESVTIKKAYNFTALMLESQIDELSFVALADKIVLEYRDSKLLVDQFTYKAEFEGINNIATVELSFNVKFGSSTFGEVTDTADTTEYSLTL